MFPILMINLQTELINTVYAQYQDKDDKFSVEHDITYDIQPDGTTFVTQNVSLTNQDTDVIATNYTIVTNQINTTEETGIEDGKNMSVKKELDEVNNIFRIKAFFNKVEIGTGAVKDFTITYKTKDILYKTGDVWYINIPKSAITKETTLYNIKVNIPSSFGNKIFLSPTPQLEKKEIKDITTYFFTKEDLLDTGITGAFGSHQVLNFKLIYQINNDTRLNSTYDIALPPDISGYQQVAYTKIEPQPKKLYKDAQGNFIAEYKVYSGNKLEIEVKGSAKLLTKQINVESGKNLKDIPKELIKEYTNEEEYWDVNDKSIKELSKKLYDENLSVSKNAENIYKYIVNNLKYDYGAVNNQYLERKGSIRALDKNESLACMEFTDLFVTLARSMGIPAREINGYAIANNNINLPSSINVKGVDLLHSWAEFYDPAFGWVQIDPTWGNTSKVDYFTKLDTNHFTFVIRGKDSRNPLPVGMYRYEDKKKLINIDFANENTDKLFETNVDIKEIFNISPIHWLLGYNRYEVTNIGNTFIYDINNKTLGPNQKTNLFIHKDVNNITYKDFNNNQKTLEITIN